MFPETNCVRTLSRPLRKNQRDVFCEKKGKIHEGRCVKEFFPLTCRLASRNLRLTSFRSSLPEVFLGKGVQSNQLQSNFIEILLRHEHSSVNLLHFFRTPFSKNTSGWLLLFFTDNFQGF